MVCEKGVGGTCLVAFPLFPTVSVCSVVILVLGARVFGAVVVVVVVAVSGGVVGYKSLGWSDGWELRSP